MTKHLMTGVAAAVLLSGVATAQPYPAVPPPPLAGGSSRASAASCPRPQHDYHDRFSNSRRRSPRNHDPQGG